MAIVHCRKCKAKITQMDATCRSCGAPTSRIIHYLLMVVVVVSIVVMALAFRENTKSAGIKEAAAKYKLSRQKASDAVTLNSDSE